MNRKDKIDFVVNIIDNTSYNTKTELYDKVSEEYLEITGEEWSSDAIRRFIARSDLLIPSDKHIITEFKEDSGVITVKSFNIKTLDEALKVSKVDLKVWEVDRYVVNSWETTMGSKKTGTGKPETYTNYQVKVWLRARKQIDFEESKREFVEEVKELSARRMFPYEVHKKTPKDNLLMLSINDLHLGRLSWHEETGEDYDHKKAISRFRESLDTLLQYSSGFTIDRILFIVGNDLINYDYATPFPRTEKGTPQTSDSRWQKLFRLGRELIVEATDTLRSIAETDVMVIPGNHDAQTIFYLGELLEAVYHNTSGVNVDNSPMRRKYYKYGENLIGATHGSKEKVRDLHAIMSAERKEWWGDSIYRYFYLGHWHHEKTQIQQVKLVARENEDYKGVIVDWLPNLAGTDAFESEMGFIGSIKSAKAAIHNYSKGRIATFNYNL